MQTYARRSRLLPLALPLLALAGAVALPRRAPAAFVFTLSQAGADVVAVGVGTLNLLGLNTQGSTTFTPSLFPDAGRLLLGVAPTGQANAYTGLSGPANFGPGGAGFAPTSNSGSAVGVIGAGGTLYTPVGYTSGLLMNNATFANQTLGSLNLTPGTYTYTWSTDTLTVNVVPEPSTCALALLGGAGMLAAARRRLRRA